METFGEDTRPRQMAEIIAKQKTREARAMMLFQVPDHLRPLVQKHVEIIFERRKCKT